MICMIEHGWGMNGLVFEHIYSKPFWLFGSKSASLKEQMGTKERERDELECDVTFADDWFLRLVLFVILKAAQIAVTT